MNSRLIALPALLAGLLLGSYGICSAQSTPAADTGTETAREDAGTALRGKRLFLRCSACHSLSDTGVARIGPTLQGVIGRKAGTLPGYRYSAAMQAADIVWNEATLDRWLTDPSALVPGTAMAFAGIAGPDDRRAIIAYLAKPPP